MGIFQTGSDPPPPMNFGTFGALFRELIFFRNFWGTFCVIFHQQFGKKVPKNFWTWSTPPPFLPKICKLLGHKKVPQNFWIGPEPSSPPMENTQIKAAFFFGPSQNVCHQTTFLSRSYITLITLKCNSLMSSFIVIFKYVL